MQLNQQIIDAPGYPYSVGMRSGSSIRFVRHRSLGVCFGTTIWRQATQNIHLEHFIQQINVNFDP